MPTRKLVEHHGDKVEVRENKNPLGVDDKTFQWVPEWQFEDMKWADIVFICNISNYGGNYTARVAGKAKEFGKFVHFDTDDLLTDLYEEHRLAGVYKEKGLGEITKFIYANSDLVTVTQADFAERIKPFCGRGLAVIKNAIDYNLPCWNAPKTTEDRLVKVGWAGGIHHLPDVKEFSAVPMIVNQRVGKENVWWDFYGHPPPDTKEQWQIDTWKEYKSHLARGLGKYKNWSVHYAMPPDAYGVMYANMDIAIAPLKLNNFNLSKSDIKVAEAIAYKVPLIASDVGCYRETIQNGVTGYLLPPGASKTEWARVMTKVIKDKKHRQEMGENLYKLKDQFDINKVVGKRLDLYEECFKRMSFDPRDSV